MRKILVPSAVICAVVVFYGCGVFKDPSTGPTFEIAGNSGTVAIDYDNNQPGDYNTGDYDADCGGCDGDGGEGAGDLCSVPSCSNVPDDTCTINGGFRECQPCAGCIPAE